MLIAYSLTIRSLRASLARATRYKSYSPPSMQTQTQMQSQAARRSVLAGAEITSSCSKSERRTHAIHEYSDADRRELHRYDDQKAVEQ